MREYKREYPPEHFIVEIKPYSLLSNTKAEKYESGVFDAGGYRWYVGFFTSLFFSESCFDYLLSLFFLFFV